jgi:hypothetical protein
VVVVVVVVVIFGVVVVVVVVACFSRKTFCSVPRASLAFDTRFPSEQRILYALLLVFESSSSRDEE